ncbi:MAG: chloride channel protein [Bacteroidetes bacterium]|nr:chloride channel protein [Bacteroidota bacterium]
MFFKTKNANNIYVLSILIGVVTGLFAIGFVWLLEQATHFVYKLHKYNFDSDIATQSFRTDIDVVTALLIVLIPSVGGLITGIITNKFSKSSAGTGVDQMIYAFHQNEGVIETKAPFYKSITTIFTLSSGGSGGKEGPIAFIGAGIGAIVSKIVNTGARARRTLLLAGTAAGLGSVFKSPLGGALTAAEMVYKEDIEADALIPCFISSVTAYIVYTWFAGSSHFMNIIANYHFHFSELPFYLLLGIMCYPFGYLFIKGFNDTPKYFMKFNLHPALKPAIGGLLVGVLSLLFFEISGTGQDFMLAVAGGKKPVFMGNAQFAIAIAFLLIALLKIVATTLTIGTGGAAGIFGPSLFIGAMLGACVGTLAQLFFDDNTVSFSSYVVVGMGAFYAGVANAPIAGIIMVCEMTGTYVLLPPLIIVSIFTFILSKKISIYKNQLPNRFASPAHFWDMRLDVLEKIYFSNKKDELRNIAVVKDSDLLSSLLDMSVKIAASDFVVVTNSNEFAGMISLRKVNVAAEVLKNETVTINNFIDKNIVALDVTEKLSAGLKTMMQHDYDKIPVADNKQFVGYLRSRDIFNTYMSLNKTDKI